MELPDRERFCKLKPQVAAKYLVDFGRYIENIWHDKKAAEEHLALLGEYGSLLALNVPSKEAALFARLSKEARYELGLKHFLCIMVPMERLYSKAASDQDFLQVSDSCGEKADKIPLFLVLHNIRSAFNVGSILRTAECLGVQKVYLTGYTAAPSEEKPLKSAMGADKYVDWVECARVEDALRELSEKEVPIVALETGPRSVSSYEYRFPKKVAVVVGNERYGIEKEVQEEADAIVSIPMLGRKNSLNVGVAVGAICFEIKRQWLLEG